MKSNKNIVMLVMDTTRARNLSCYGHGRDTSPFLDSIAKEGIKFENCYANAPWTLPSHYSIFTGKTPLEHDYNSKDKRGRIGEKTLPEKLSEKGYETIGISNNGYVSPLFGFEDYFDTFHFNAESAAIESKLLFENDQIFIEMLKGEREDRWSSTGSKYLDFLKKCVSEFSPKSLANGAYYLVNQKLLSRSNLEDDGAEISNKKAFQEVKNAEKPYFLFINYVEPHTPYSPPEEYAKNFLNDKDWEDAKQASKKDSLSRLRKGQKKDSEAKLLEALYDAEIRYLDKKIEELVKALDDEDEDTVFIILSDHGEYFGENNLWEHMGKLGSEVLKVPLLVKNAGNENPEEIFPLNNIHDYVLNISEGKSKYRTGSLVSYYEGINSHQWDVSRKKLPKEYFERQIYFSKEGELKYFREENFSDVMEEEIVSQLKEDSFLEDLEF